MIHAAVWAVSVLVGAVAVNLAAAWISLRFVHDTPTYLGDT